MISHFKVWVHTFRLSTGEIHQGPADAPTPAKDELANSLEYNLELGIVFAFKVLQLPGQVMMRGKHPSKVCECPHDGYIHLDG
jgi:hypothetical protein